MKAQAILGSLVLMVIYQGACSASQSSFEKDSSEELVSSEGIIDLLINKVDSLQQHQKEQDKENQRLQKEIERLKTRGVATGADFTACPSVSMTYNPGTTIQFGEVLTNIGGFFNADTGIFICPVDGLYYFFVSLYTNDDADITGVLYLDGTRKVEVHSNYNGGIHGVTSLVTECNVFQSVWVECIAGGTIPGNRRTSFSGFILAETTI